MKNLKCYQVFIASPGKLDEERTKFYDILRDYNEMEAYDRNLNFRPVGWELTLGGVGRPQGLINEQIKECDYMIVVLHNRWGSPTKPEGEKEGYSSGTEEEFHFALECLKSKEHEMKDIIIFFKKVDEEQLADPGPQLKKVLDFRKERENEKDLMYHIFDSPKSFEKYLRKHLGSWARKASNENNEILEFINPKLYKKEVDHFKEQDDVEVANLLNKAEHLANSGQIIDAELIFSKLIVSKNSAWAFARYGKFLRKLGQNSKAKDMIDSAISIAEKTENKLELAYAIRKKAQISIGEGKLKKGIELFKNSLDLYTEGEYTEGEAKSLRDIGYNLHKIGENESAIRDLNLSLVKYTKLKDKSGVASVYSYIGLIYKNIGKLSEAKKMQEEALKIHKEQENNFKIAIDYSNIGVIERLIGNLDIAECYHKKALKAYQEAKDIHGFIRECNNLGIIYQKQGKLNDAEKILETGRFEAAEIGNKRSVAIALSNLGTVKKLQNKLNDAEKYYFKSLELQREIGDKRGEALQLNNLGICYATMENYKEALEHIETSIEISKKISYRLGTANATREKGKILLKIDSNKENAKSLLTESLNIFKDIEMHNEYEVTNKILNAIKI